MQNVTKQHLQDAKQLLIEKGWHKGSRALNKNKEWCSALSEDAVSFCLMGALERALPVAHPIYMHNNYNASAYGVLETILARPFCRNIVDFNDAKGTSKGDVLALLDRAIASVKD